MNGETVSREDCRRYSMARGEVRNDGLCEEKGRRAAYGVSGGREELRVAEESLEFESRRGDERKRGSLGESRRRCKVGRRTVGKPRATRRSRQGRRGAFDTGSDTGSGVVRHIAVMDAVSAAAGGQARFVVGLQRELPGDRTRRTRRTKWRARAAFAASDATRSRHDHGNPRNRTAQVSSEALRNSND